MEIRTDLSDKFSAEVLRVLSTPINGEPSIIVVNYSNAHRLLSVALACKNVEQPRLRLPYPDEG